MLNREHDVTTEDTESTEKSLFSVLSVSFLVKRVLFLI